MLTSPQNDKIKRIRRLQDQSRSRREEQAFVIEGVRLVEEARLHGWRPELVLHTGDLDSRGKTILQEYRGEHVPVIPVSPEVMQAASDTETPQGLLAVLPLHSRPQPSRLDFVLLADAVRDPGNLGTLLRTALAAGVDLVLLPPGTVDPYSPKVVRGGMGAHFQLPILKTSWEEIRKTLAHLRVFVADAHRGSPHTRADLTQPLALVIGSEAHGPGEKAAALGDEWLHIPMPGQAESLNSAVAGSILLFEVVRQRINL
jgi:TrmH family RNA methyltransferase